MDTTGFLAFLRKKVDSIGSQKEAAVTFGISAQYLNDILFGRRVPGDDVLARMGFERTITYRIRNKANR